VQYIADNQLYNSIITAHAIIMIFFMVKKNFILNLYFTFFKKVNNNNDSPLLNECDINNNSYKPDNEDNQNKNYNNTKHKYVKVFVDDPYNNRDIIIKVANKQKGVYL
jgi:hypothetical protein